MEYTRVRDAGFEYATALREDEEDEVAAKKADDVDEKTTQCDLKFDEAEDVLKISYWTRFAEEGFNTLAEEAELAMDQAEASNYQQLSRRERELVSKDLEREIFELSKPVNEWEDCVPRPNLTASRDRTRRLRRRQEKLSDKWIWRSWSQAEDYYDDEKQADVKDEKQGETSVQAMLASANPEPNLLCPVETETPVHSIQNYGLPTMLPNLLPADQPSSPRGTLNVLQGGSGTAPGAYSFKPHIALERARPPVFSQVSSFGQFR